MSNTIEKRIPPISEFSRTVNQMIATNENSYNVTAYSRGRQEGRKIYSLEEIQKILTSGTLEEKISLSRAYFNYGGTYQRIIIHYATLLNYVGILIPHSEKVSDNNVIKRYNKALDYIEKMNLKNLLTQWSLKALVDGTYYGLIQAADQNTFAVIDLPTKYCRSNFKDQSGIDIVEFDVTYFDSITDLQNRLAALHAYPNFVRKAYYRYKKNHKPNDKWLVLPTNLGFCFPLTNGMPPFLKVLPALEQYEDAVDTELIKDKEEIKKILVQRVPHLNDGGFLLEPQEVSTMHRGAVEMLKKNENIAVLTTYADIDAIVSKTAADSVSNTIDKMYQNVYNNSGTSSQIFSATGNLAISTSIINDISFMMMLANKYSTFITATINNLFSNNKVRFKYEIQPVSLHNMKDYLDSTLKAANSGYSFLMPALALGLTQKDIVNVKDLENDVLKLTQKFIPLTSSFTQSPTNGEAGAPEKPDEEKNPKTLQNEAAIDKQGVEENNE